MAPIIAATMASYTTSIQNLMNELSRLPGIGMRSAERIAFHLLTENQAEAFALADAIRDVKTRIRHCAVCYNLTENDPCDICSDPGRDQGLGGRRAGHAAPAPGRPVDDGAHVPHHPEPDGSRPLERD